MTPTQRLRQTILALSLAASTILSAQATAALQSTPTRSVALTADAVPLGLVRSDWQSIRAAYEAERHAFQPVAGRNGVWQARNPGQQLLSTFDGRGFLAQPQGADWRWGLELQSYGFGAKQHAVGGTPAIKAEGRRLSYQWDNTVQEWFINDRRGLEHGFIVAQRPRAATGATTAVDVSKCRLGKGIDRVNTACGGGAVVSRFSEHS
jgi:hypothetical protein